MSPVACLEVLECLVEVGLPAVTPAGSSRGAVALGDSWAGWSADLTVRQIVTASSSKAVRSW